MSWPEAQDFVHGEPVPPPGAWRAPGLVMFFNLECAACVTRGIPFLKRLHREHDGTVTVVAVHTSRGHRELPREDVEPTLRHFAGSFAKLPFPVALDVNGSLAAHYGTEGTPHWLAFDREGRLVRSVYGSQENAQTRLAYLLDELTQEGSST